MIFGINMETDTANFTPMDSYRTWKQNKAIVRRQLNQIAAEVKAKKAAVLNPPSDVSRRAVKWWKAIIQNGHMRRGVLRHRNGKPLTKKAMSNLLGCSIDTIERAVRELIEKGYVYNDGGYFKVNLNPNVTVV